jgi:uncharacterized LabA/DUF88 family protein
MRTHVYIDASNLFYGGEKSLGWKIDYEKLRQYFVAKYQADEIHYFGGIELHNFPFDYLLHDSVPLADVEMHLTKLLTQGETDEAMLLLISKHLKRIRFYKKLASFGYILHLKPVKLYENEDGSTRRKANCDVDMTLSMLQNLNRYDRVLVLSGDGDFLPVLKYLASNNKSVVVLARGIRTAKEIRRFAGSNFRDFTYLETIVGRTETKKEAK